MAQYKSQRGFHSLEIIISFAIFALFIAGIFILFSISIKENFSLLKYAKANSLIVEGFNAVRSIRDNDWDSLVAGDHGLQLSEENSWSFVDEFDLTDNIFNRTITINDLADEGKDVTIEVSWNFFGRLLSKVVSTRFTNWKNIEVWGNWGNPVVVGSLDIGPQGQASRVMRNGNYAFLTAEVSTDNRPSLYSIDITDPTAPSIVDSYIGGGSLLDLTLVSNQYLYAVGKINHSELMIFNISDPSNIIFVKSIDFNNKDCLNIYAFGSTVFIGSENSIFIYNTSNPESPTLLSTYSVGAEVNDLLSNGNYLYSATSKSSEEILILSIADLSHPTYAGSYDVSGSTDALSLDLKGTVLYMGSDNNSSTNPELYQFDTTNPINLIKKNSRDTGGAVKQIATAGQYVYLATGSSNNEFQIWQTASNWELIYEAGLNMAQMATGIAFDENTIFISLRSNDAFKVIQPAP